MTTDLKYLIIEDSLKVCEGIAERIQPFTNWTACVFAHHVDDAKQIASAEKPQLIFIDWALKGGSAYEVLLHIQTIPDYYPYIIFNTGYQSENPEIPQEIINNYKIDKYVVKPLWENLRNNLSTYLIEAEKKLEQTAKLKQIWLTDIHKRTVQINLQDLVCICQEVDNHYHKSFCLHNQSTVTVRISWHEIIDVLKENEIDFFVTNSRHHLIIKKYIECYKRPYIKLKNFGHKIEVVKEKLHEFDMWLGETNQIKNIKINM